jgi:hypothetical protein
MPRQISLQKIKRLKMLLSPFAYIGLMLVIGYKMPIGEIQSLPSLMTFHACHDPVFSLIMP